MVEEVGGPVSPTSLMTRTRRSLVAPVLRPLTVRGLVDAQELHVPRPTPSIDPCGIVKPVPMSDCPEDGAGAAAAPELATGASVPAEAASAAVPGRALFDGTEEEERDPLGATVTEIGEEAPALVAAALFETATDVEAAVVAAPIEPEAAAEEDEAEELGLERIRTPVLTAASGLVIPLDPTVPGVAIGTAVAWTAYPPGPPLDGRTAPTAGAIAKPTSAISPTTSTHHVRERSALMTTGVASAPPILRLGMLCYTPRGQGDDLGPPPSLPAGARLDPAPGRGGSRPPSDRLPDGKGARPGAGSLGARSRVARAPPEAVADRSRESGGRRAPRSRSAAPRTYGCAGFKPRRTSPRPGRSVRCVLAGRP